MSAVNLNLMHIDVRPTIVKLETSANLSGLYKKLVVWDDIPSQIATLNVNITLLDRCLAARHLRQFWWKIYGIIRNILFSCKNNFIRTLILKLFQKNNLRTNWSWFHTNSDLFFEISIMQHNNYHTKNCNALNECKSIFSKLLPMFLRHKYTVDSGSKDSPYQIPIRGLKIFFSKFKGQNQW